MWQLSTIVFIILNISQCFVMNSPKIYKIVGPEILLYGSKEAVTLDCQFHTNETTDLTIKWYFNDTSHLVYRWKPPNKPQAFGIFKKQFDLSHVASNNPSSQYRALHIKNPTPFMSGKYICAVTNRFSEDRMTHSMTIYETEKKSNLILDRLKNNTIVNIIYKIEGVYPYPKLELFAANRLLNSTSKITKMDDSLYKGVASALIKTNTLDTTVEIIGRMEIPEANYVHIQREIFYRDPNPYNQNFEINNDQRRITPALILILISLFISWGVIRYG
nr:uncharacterized protein LOC113397228 [Vanessa tameamea]